MKRTDQPQSKRRRGRLQLAVLCGLALLVLAGLGSASPSQAAPQNHPERPAQPSDPYPSDSGLMSAMAPELAASGEVQTQASDVTAQAGEGVQEGSGLPGSVGARTLVLYDTTGEKGWLGELYAQYAANLVSHFGSWRVEPVAQYQAGQLEGYTATIYIGSTYNEPLPDAFLDDAYTTAKPVIWIYNNIWELSNRQASSFSGKYGWVWSHFDMGQIDTVRYKGVALKRNGAANQAGIMDYASVDPTKATVLAEAVRQDGSSFPWALRSGNLTYVGENPFIYTGEKDRAMIFADLLFDALDPAAGERHRALVRLEDINPSANANQLKSVADYLYSQGVPFTFGVSPLYRDPLGVEHNGRPTEIRLSKVNAVINAIKYLQSKGGTMIYHGYTHQYSNVRNPYDAVSGDDFEFYRTFENADHTLTFQGPLAEDSAAWFNARIDAGLAEFDAAKIARPTMFEFPHYAASYVDYQTVATRYATRYERGLYFKGHLSGGAIDYGKVIGQMYPYMACDVYGSIVLPENIGDYEPEPFFQYPEWHVSDILEAADKNMVVRDGFASFYYHPIWGTTPLQQIVAGLKARGWTFASANNLRGGDTPPGREAIAPQNTALPTISGTVQEGRVLTAATGSWNFQPTSFDYQWQVCDAAWFGCFAIEGATQETYMPRTADVGHNILVTVTAMNASGSTAASSNETVPVARDPNPQPPVSTALPVISGTTQPGQTLQTSTGSWTGTLPITYSYQWLRCGSAGGNCAGLADETDRSYTLTAADLGKTMRVWVSATNGYGSATAQSAATSQVTTADSLTPPENTSPPTISGFAHQGQTLTGAKGSWVGNPTPTFAYQWRRCDTAGANCAAITGATATTYALTSADVNHTIRFQVTGSNSVGSDTATSGQSDVVDVVQSPPQNTTLPTVSGTAQQGQVLTSSTGGWSGYPTPTYAYQWLRCDTTGAGCTNITGATGSSYTLTAGDVGQRLRSRVTANNSLGAAATASDPTAVVASAAPVNTVLPTISGTAKQGQTLSTSTGSWANSPSSYAYQWLRCDTAGNGCADIAGASATTYTLASTDVGQTLRARVTATNGYGSTSAQSAPTAVIASAAPSNTTLPTVAGTAKQGGVLTAQTGSWANSPSSYAYQWLRCDTAGAGCADISGASATTYTLVAGDVGQTLRVRVTATNGYGSTSAQSAPTAVIASAAPSNSALPVISGTAKQGQTLSASTGSWTNSPASYAYQWLRCDTAGNGCADIAGATAASYQLVASDVGKTLRVRVTAANSYGSTPATSAQTAVVLTAKPQNTALPTVTGTAKVGYTLTGTRGTWSNSPSSYAYRWLRCGSSGGNCTGISGATALSHKLVAADKGHTLRLRVTATNAYGSTIAQSAQTAVIK